MFGMGGRNQRKVNLNVRHSEPRSHRVPTGLFTTTVTDPEPLTLTVDQSQALSTAYENVRTALQSLLTFEEHSHSSPKAEARRARFCSQVQTIVDEINNYILKPNAKHTADAQRTHKLRLNDLNRIRNNAYCKGLKNGFIAGVIRTFLGVVALITADKTLLRLLGGEANTKKDFDKMTMGRSFKHKTHQYKADRRKFANEFYTLSNALTHFKTIAKNPTAQPAPANKNSL